MIRRGLGSVLEITEKQLREATTFSKRLKLAMAAKGMGPVAFAKAIGAKRQTIYYWLDGTTKSPDSHHLEKGAGVLGVRPRWLLTGEMPMFMVPQPKDDDEIQLMGFYQTLDPARRKSLLEIAEGMAAKSAAKPTAASPFRAKVPR